MDSKINRQIEPSASWLLCTHQEDALLHRAIKSCLTQTVEDHELILITNGPKAGHIASSLANTYASDERVRVFSTQIHFLNFSLNLGLHLARSPFIARMDADDVSQPNRLLQQLNFMKNNEDVAVLGSSYLLIDSFGTTHGKINVPCTDAKIKSSLWTRNPICHPTVMLRREAILEAGGYLGGRNSEDYDLWLRLASTKKWRFANLSEPLLSYNISPDGAARRSRAAYANITGTQIRQFLESRDPRWLLSATLSATKSFILAEKP